LKTYNQRKRFIVVDDNEIYKRCRVQIQGKGILLRDEVFGKDIKTKKQQLCKINDFIVAEIDAKVGGFGILPPNLENAIVSSHYFIFEIIKEKLLPEFLSIIVKQKEFLKQVKSTGSTNYSAIRPYHVLDYKIPLPSLEKQQELVVDYNSKFISVANYVQQTVELQEKIEDYLLDELGVKTNTISKKNSMLQLVNFKETNRWDTLFLLGKIPSLKSKYPLVNFSEVIKFFNKDINHNSLRIDSSKFPNDEFRYIGMEHIEKETGKLLNLPLVKGKEIKSQTIKVPKNFIVYGKLRPYLNKYWINNTEFNNIICSSEFFVFNIDSKINKLFFKNVLSSKIIQDQIADKTSGARMPRINEDIFLNLQIPLPPFEIQNKIASKISNYIENMDKLKTDANNLRLEAEEEFEKAIFI
jgi:type I restriction enzyme S subunit